MAEARMLFLICSERSGSNLIRAMLDAHPEVSAPQPLHFVRDVIARADAMAFGQRGSAVADAMMASLRKSLAKQFPEDQAAAIAARAEAADPFTPREIMRAVYHGVAEVTGARLVMIKENELHEAAAQIIDAFPDARFVFQVRDPRDYLASAVALKTGRFGNKFGSLRNALRIWAADQQFGLRMLGHFGPGRVYFQRYEDLVANPEAVLRGLCDFAGLAFAPEMLAFHQSEGVQQFSTRKAAWENLSRPVMSGNFNKYRKSLSRRQITATEAALGPLMQRLGYALDTKPGKRWPLIWPTLVEPFERAANKAWTPFFTVANTKHHARLDRLAEPVTLPYSGRSTADLRPGQWPRTAVDRVLAQAVAHPDRTALRVDGQDLSYDQLFGAAVALAETLPPGRPVIGVYAARHASAYIAILAVMLAGGSYVPLNCRFPDARNREIVKRSGLTHVLHGADFQPAVARILTGTDAQAVPVAQSAPPLSQSDWTPRHVSLSDVAYTLFTSGSTGVPKGVAISHGNLAAYLDNALAALAPTPEDRFSQTFDLTFDLSVHDLFVAWSAGAALCVASQGDLSDPARYIRRDAITQFFCVPSLGYTLRQGGALTPGAFPGLRCTLFCGEALPSDLARDWQAATPGARVENWYGPTEATIACLRHDLAEGAGDGIVPIGKPFAGMTALVIGEDGQEAPEGETGALYLAGPQVAAGYLNDPDKTAAAFVALPGRSGRFYDTGDLVSKHGGVLRFHGRRDFQVKIRGYRVELGEIENALRAQAGGANVVALTWPHGAVNASHVIAVLESDEDSPTLDRAALRDALPDYMLPSSAFGLAAFPSNASGKVDRGAIAAAIDARIKARKDADDGSFEGRVLALILRVKPTLDPGQIRQAENLLMAGLDSLDFVNLTILFEEDFGAALTEDRVAALANLSFTALVADLERGQAASDALAQIPEDRMVRANRAITFLSAFPALVGRAQAPLLLAYGSSGTMRGIDTRAAEAEARDAGHSLRVLNIGLPALTSQGLARMARFVQQTCEGATVAGVLHELDPMLLSVVPPKGDIALDEAVYASGGMLRLRQGGGVELDWASEQGGMLTVSPAPAKAKKKKALWERDRDHEIAQVYRGALGFEPEAVTAWIEATQALRALKAPVLGWVHPLAEGDVGGGAFDAMLAQVESGAGVRVLRPQQLALDAGLFLNLNHMAPGAGMEALTRQLLQQVLAISPERPQGA